MAGSLLQDIILCESCLKHFAGRTGVTTDEVDVGLGRGHVVVTAPLGQHIEVDTSAESHCGESVARGHVVDVLVDAGGFRQFLDVVVDSDVAKESHFHIYLDVEEEKSVAATKTYIAELFALDMLAEALGGKINNDYEALADRINDVLDLDKDIKEIAEGIVNENNFLILSRSSTLGSADELCLKLTECCYLFAKSFSSATFMHGPLSLLTAGTNLIMFAPNSKNTQEYIDMATRAKEKGANLIAFSDIPEVLSLASYKVKMPRTDMITAPVLYGVAASLLALNIGEAKGYNVDSPRNLNKVTVTL